MKSPIKDKPLRNPGESLDNEIQDYILSEVGPYIFIPIILIIFTLLEWYRWFFANPPAPLFYTTTAILSIAYSYYKIRKSQRKLHALKQGRDGEKAVGQYLNSLREFGVHVQHDIQGDRFNLDHVAISESGIYVIETKTYSKPDKGNAKILFKGETIVINEKTETEAPITQVKAAAHWLTKLLEETTGKKFIIKPVVVFPGWFVEPTYESKLSDVWVLNPKALPTFIKNSRAQLSPEDVKLASYHLSRYTRTT